ncbi:HDOD domain-containing protein [Duganella sp. BJB488]|uniref:EAL and HDOD domain-containing protein n=1 Tax=unclassified Duganella TaxID=2636909 RepID=UPI000E342432|nr:MULTISPECIES: HDOD domain-containing protein [unclassified Duganella]NVD70827.1 HDOD domain-containing protein [Duganella sp. BJB1802]RFP10529.1 HDOD domain-containing protein [Duganella sp. BJB489]RFP14211.1 HDOD domain-containing protein [Duganella sp. BJB488]RFP30148.1 HDOD domain-containing protein [Duganella sp. BJB480]
MVIEFPLVELQAVSNAHNEWVALTFDLSADSGDAFQAALTLLKTPDVFAALAPLDCILPVPQPALLELSHLETLPPNRVILRVPAAACAEPAVQKKLSGYADAGYRIMIEGVAGMAATLCGARSLMVDAAQALPPVLALVAQPGPHLATGMGSEQRIAECAKAGFSWFAGDFALHPPHDASAGDGTSRKRLLALLGLLARDADSRELEVLLKQDPALSYHLLKLVNSAAFALSSPIHSFSQAINVLGRRQLQRWLQLLLYARQQDDGMANPLLPLAAVRAAQMEALSKALGWDRDQQDMAFVAGVFSLLDVLLGMPMTEIVAALSLDLDVVMALLDRGGPLGELLALVERHDRAALDRAGIEHETYWQAQLQAYHWAIQVSRNI